MKPLIQILLLVVIVHQLPAQNVFPTSGNAGIGTTTPGTYALNIQRSNTDGGDTDAPVVSIKNTSTFQPNGSGLNAAWTNLYAGNSAVLGQVVANYGVGAAAPFSAGSGVYLTSRTNHPIIFTTGSTSTEKMRITSDGKIGIGTPTPGGNFSLVGSHSNTIEAHILNTNATGFSALRLGVDAIATSRTVIHDFNGSYPGTGAYTANTSNFGSYNTNGLNITADNASGVIRMFTGGSLPANQRLMIDASGKVGINTNAPGALLEINATTSTFAGGFNPNLRLKGGAPAVQWWDDNDNNGWQIGSQTGSLYFGALTSQTTQTYSLLIDASGNVGIGTTAPTAKLEVNGAGRFAGGSGSFVIGAITGVNRVQTYPTGPTIRFWNAANTYANVGSGALSVGGNYANTAAPANGALIEGAVCIGTSSLPAVDAKLAVNGYIYSKKVKVIQTGWADYVFDAGYRLRPLSEVEQYIQQHRHLPEVPSAAEVEKNGLDLGDNQATLLKKIEELTLYMIEQNKKMELQQLEINELRKELKQCTGK